MIDGLLKKEIKPKTFRRARCFLLDNQFFKNWQAFKRLNEPNWIYIYIYNNPCLSEKIAKKIKLLYFLIKLDIFLFHID